MEYALIALLAFIVGFRIAEALHQMAFRKIMEELGIKESQLRDLARKNGLKLEDEPDPKADPELELIEVKLEQHQGQIYAFRTDTDQFLGQGTDRESLIAALKQRLNNVRLVISEENGANLIKQPNEA